jgi:hypothetical protein
MSENKDSDPVHLDVHWDIAGNNTYVQSVEAKFYILRTQK